MKKKHKFTLSSKVEGFCQNVSVDTLNAATTNSMDFFSRKTDKSSQDYRTYLTTIKLLKTIAFFKNVHLTNAIQFWQPCFFGQRTGNFLLSARNNFAEVPERTSEPYWNLLQKNSVFLTKTAGHLDYSFNNPADEVLPKSTKNSQGQKKITKLQNFQRNWSFHKWPSQPFECCFEGIGKAVYWRVRKVLAQNPNLKQEKFP